MGIVTGYLAQLVNNGIKLLNGGTAVSSSNPLPVLSNASKRQSSLEAGLKGVNYKGWVTQAATSAKYSSVQMWNPANSGYALLLTAASAYIGSGSAKVFPLISATPLANNNGFIQNINSANQVAHFEMRSEALTGLTANNSVGVTLTTTNPPGAGILMSGEFYVIMPGYGLSYECNVANIAETLQITCIEVPVSEL